MNQEPKEGASPGTGSPQTPAPLVYRDLNLRFSGWRFSESGGGGSFKVWVEGEAPGGTMRPDDAFDRTYDPRAFWADPVRGIGGLLGAVDRASSKPDDLFKLGTLLADLALPEGPVRRLFQASLAVVLREGQGLRLRLRIDPVELRQLPWEFTVLPQTSGEPQATDFLALRREISIVRTDTVEAAPRPLPERAVARVVGVLSSPYDQDKLRVNKDQEAIDQAVQALNGAAKQRLIEIEWATRPATRGAMQQALEGGADVFHFAGHATFDPDADEGQIVLEQANSESDYYSGKDLLAPLLRGAGVRLAILGACETGRRDGRNVWSGVAPALTRERIPAVIANQFDIEDDNAVLVASRLYPRILAGATVDEALYEARQTVYQQTGLQGRDWGVPVLYLHEASGVLFPLPKPEAGGEPGAVAGPFLRVAGTFQRVTGQVIGAEIARVTGGRIEVKQDVGVVEKGAVVKGVVIGSFGSSGH